MFTLGFEINSDPLGFCTFYCVIISCDLKCMNYVFFGHLHTIIHDEERKRTKIWQGHSRTFTLLKLLQCCLGGRLWVVVMLKVEPSQQSVVVVTLVPVFFKELTVFGSFHPSVNSAQSPCPC